jgi:CBS domain containing-hemolysin-like protein
MKTVMVKDLMIPIAQYATVSYDASLGEALMALQDAQTRLDEDREKHRAILVYNENKRIIGKLNMWDVLKGIEPGYRRLNYPREAGSLGSGPEFLKSLLATYGLWRKPLEDICRQGARMKVRDIMHAPSTEEYIGEDAYLPEAINMLVMGRHLSLLVTRQDDIVGVLRLSDVFQKVREQIQSCAL